MSTISFKVLFDPEKSLKPKHYDIVTPVHLLYYDEYIENSDGVVVSNGTAYSHPLGKVSFDVELPGRILLCVGNSTFFQSFYKNMSGPFRATLNDRKFMVALNPSHIFFKELCKKLSQQATFDILKFSSIARPRGHKQKKWINMGIQFPLLVSSRPRCQAERVTELNFGRAFVWYQYRSIGW